MVRGFEPFERLRGAPRRGRLWWHVTLEGRMGDLPIDHHDLQSSGVEKAAGCSCHIFGSDGMQGLPVRREAAGVAEPG